MYKYKDSDVGERVWKEIVAGPTWIPPASTPPRELLKRRKWKDGKPSAPSSTTARSAPATPPPTASSPPTTSSEVKDAEGNVTAELRQPASAPTAASTTCRSCAATRTAATASTTCRAVRLFSFILQHREFVREGQTKLGFGREFEWEDKQYKLSLKTRGYRYQVTRPIPVEVQRGRIQGKRKSPIEGYVAKPIAADAEDPSAEELPGPAAPAG
jgi:hypothetical protein